MRFTDEELKHQELFRRIEAMVGESMPAGYRFDVDPDDVAARRARKRTWAVLALTCTSSCSRRPTTARASSPTPGLSELFKDVFLFHWKDESQHAILDELEWSATTPCWTLRQRDRGGRRPHRAGRRVDGILQGQARSDAAYFADHCGRAVDGAEAAAIAAHFLKAYRWQYILSGAGHPRFQSILKGLINGPQMARIEMAVSALA